MISNKNRQSKVRVLKIGVVCSAVVAGRDVDATHAANIFQEQVVSLKKRLI